MQESMDLPELIHILLNKLWLILLVSVIGLLLAFGYTKVLVTPQYSSSVEFYVSSNQNTANQATLNTDLTAASKLVTIYTEILKSDTVLENVISSVKDFDLTEMKPAELRKMLTISSVSDTGIMQVKVASADPNLSASIANTIAQVAPDRIIQITKAGYVETVDEAKPDPIPTSPKVLLNCVIGFMLGLVLTVLYIVVHELFDQRIKGEEDIKKYYNIPVLGEIPNFHSQFKGGYERYE